MKSMTNRKFIATAVIAAFAFGCAHNKTEDARSESPIKSDTAKVAEKRGEHLVTTLKFDKGQTSLSADAKAELDRAIAEARSQGEIEEITVAVWSDMDYPGTKGRKLSSNQVEIADDRGEEIEDYLSEDRDISGLEVDVHNMGEKPGFLSEFFNTADAELKEQLAAQGITNSSGAPVGGKASSALVFIKLKE